MRLTGDIDVFILGINHNASYEGENLIHFCIGKKNGTLVALYNEANGSEIFTSGDRNDPENPRLGLYVERLYNTTTDNNRIGFGGSGMADMCGRFHEDDYGSIVNSSSGVIGSLPNDLKTVMKTAIKSYDTYQNQTYTELPMSIPSVYELRGYHAGATESWSDQNQLQYDYFKSGNSYTAYKLGCYTSGSPTFKNQPVTFWTRNRVSSSRDSSDSCFVAVVMDHIESAYDTSFNFACMFLFFV